MLLRTVAADYQIITVVSRTTKAAPAEEAVFLPSREVEVAAEEHAIQRAEEKAEASQELQPQPALQAAGKMSGPAHMVDAPWLQASSKADEECESEVRGDLPLVCDADTIAAIRAVSSSCAAALDEHTKFSTI
eukprot:SAG11_NODE_12_length_27025_cov_37.402681_25_plen_133_part_00